MERQKLLDALNRLETLANKQDGGTRQTAMDWRLLRDFIEEKTEN